MHVQVTAAPRILFDSAQPVLPQLLLPVVRLLPAMLPLNFSCRSYAAATAITTVATRPTAICTTISRYKSNQQRDCKVDDGRASKNFPGFDRPTKKLGNFTCLPGRKSATSLPLTCTQTLPLRAHVGLADELRFFLVIYAQRFTGLGFFKPNQC